MNSTPSVTSSSSERSSALLSNLTQSSITSYTSDSSVKFTSDEFSDDEFDDSEEEFDVDYLCPECSRPRTNDRWCNFCESQKFSKNFNNWTSGNSYLDKIIRDTQLHATKKYDYLVWIDYSEFEDIEYLTKGGYGEVYYGIWIYGPNKVLIYEEEKCKWKKEAKTPVALKCLHNSENVTADFLDEYWECLEGDEYAINLPQNRGNTRGRRVIKSHPKAVYISRLLPQPPNEKEYSRNNKFAISESEFSRRIAKSIGQLQQLKLTIDEKDEDSEYVTRAFGETLSVDKNISNPSKRQKLQIL
ncbi:21376_t:CDS:2 [Racocetra persica]|uniref:21376_t:CDS:1 n=1 Tax=Racocetra persica TaxID=160502 RepID=A0ACA9NCI5_9GLOM|nr:21376_t:CDS:2 [Racocetra persica]